MALRGRNRRTALILIDFVNLFDFEGAKRLASRAVRAARQSAVLIERSKRAKTPVIYANDNFGRWNSDFFRLVDECKQRGGASASIVAALQPSRDNYVVLKPMHSAFYGTPLEFLLEELQVTRLILAGIAVDMCVFATAQDAHVRKFPLWVPKDCVAGFNASQERSALNHMARTRSADVSAIDKRRVR